jgi:hypothetical protein
MTRVLGAAALIVGSATMFAAYGQQMPAEYEQAMKTLGKMELQPQRRSVLAGGWR